MPSLGGSKMKTIYDFETDGEMETVFIHELKEEAIKEIKALRMHHIPKEYRQFIAYGVDSETTSNVVRYIMWKFNITEKDLK